MAIGKLPKVHLLLVAKEREVFAATHTFSGTQKKEFKAALVEEVFSLTFLRTIAAELNRSTSEVRNSGNRAAKVLQLLKVKTVGELLRCPYQKLADAPGLGPGSLALILDVLRLFGFEIKGTPDLVNGKLNETETKAAELAATLGLVKK